MNNRDDLRRQEGRSQRSEAQRGSSSLLELFGQMMMFPLSVFVYGMELFVKTIQGVQRAADEGVTVLVGSPSQTLVEAEEVNRNPEVTPIGEGRLESSLAISSTDGLINNEAEKDCKETINMSDTNLNDDMLKLVRYKILFVKRDYETAFPEREELVFDNLTGEGFAAWKVAEFIQRLAIRTTEVPESWHDYPVNQAPPLPPYRDKNVLLGLPEKDKKYLRVYFEVLARYEREEARHEEDQIAVLKEIRNRL